MNRSLTQSELEQLSAYLDSELEASEARRVEALLATDAAWKQAADELQALDSAMDQWTAPPPPTDLAQRIIMASRGEQMAPALVIRLVKYLAPVAAAAAAAVLLVAFLHQPAGNAPAPDGGQIAATDKQDVDTLVQEHLDFFKQYKSLDSLSSTESVADDATLQALDKLEQGKGS